MANRLAPAKTADDKRTSDLRVDAIRDAINAHFPNPPGDVVAEIDPSGNVGSFVSEYMAYHVAWYRDYINAKHPDDPSKQCRRAGHTHVGVQVAVDHAETAVDIQLDKLFEVLP